MQNFFSELKYRLKYILAKQELIELSKWRFVHTQYAANLEKFEDVSLVLKNMYSAVKGVEPLNNGYRLTDKGPFDISGLKYRLGRSKVAEEDNLRRRKTDVEDTK